MDDVRVYNRALSQAEIEVLAGIAQPTQFTLTVSKGGTGTGGVVSSPAGIDCGVTCAYDFDATTLVTLTATPDANSTFTGWTGAGCSGTGTCQVTMDAAKSVTASFALKTYTLSVGKAGTGIGVVTSDQGGINCGLACSADFSYNTFVTLTAAPDASSTFTGWGGDCSGMGTCQVTMSTAKSVTASFALKTFVLSVSKTGTGAGIITSAPAGIDCGLTCAAAYNYNTPVTLTAAPDSGSTFIGWSGACSGAGACQVTMDAAKSVTAEFSAAVAPGV